MCDVDLLGLGQHGDRGRRGVDATLGLGDRHPLHPVRTALVLHAGPHAVAGQTRNVISLKPPMSDGLDAEHLELPAHAGGVAPVHLEQVAGEEVGLLAALGAADLDDDVLVVVGVAGQQQHLDLVVEPLDGGSRPRRSRPAASSRSSAEASVYISWAAARSVGGARAAARARTTIASSSR